MGDSGEAQVEQWKLKRLESLAKARLKAAELRKEIKEQKEQKIEIDPSLKGKQKLKTRLNEVKTSVENMKTPKDNVNDEIVTNPVDSKEKNVQDDTHISSHNEDSEKKPNKIDTVADTKPAVREERIEPTPKLESTQSIVNENPFKRGSDGLFYI
tara:strand:+ start:692 stop:1156 length:465 start_codon:yes stop_codon:yes gene_type:complete